MGGAVRYGGLDCVPQSRTPETLMGAAIFNIVIGVLAILGAFSGRFVFPGTHGPTVLAVIGGAIAALGVYQLIKLKR